MKYPQFNITQKPLKHRDSNTKELLMEVETRRHHTSHGIEIDYITKTFQLLTG